MKTLKYCLSAFILTLAFPSMIKATDLVVAAGGAGGAYASINAALAAAAPNDRIIVYPQAGGGAYSDTNIRITKSIQILSANEGAYYAVDAPVINITPSTAGINVTIIGMKLLTGSIFSTIASPTGSRSTINLLNDSLSDGLISINHDNYDLTVASSHVQAGLTFRFGKAIGNIIRSAVTINSDASVNNPLDTVLVIGNKVFGYTASNYSGIYWNSTTHFFAIQNNFISLTYYLNGYGTGIFIATSKNSTAGINMINNNTVYKASTALSYGIYFTGAASSYTEILNNLIAGSASYAVYVTSGNVSVHYNYFTSASLLGFTNDGTNITATNVTLNAEGLNTNPLSNTINGGTTDSAYADIDLTRNDVGCYGGSFTLNNFFPITSNDWARVILVTAPRRVLVNGTIHVKAIGFDK
ncbi:MAG: hypothetical protein IPP46_19660 [Bacteroidetes bacterium]|nr:hypothetical protein [Bacteroidota bacterium]